MKPNFSQPLGAQSLQLRQELRVVSLGPLAVPRQKRLAGPSLPPAGLTQVLHEASAIRASRLEKFLPEENLFLCGDAKRPGRWVSWRRCLRRENKFSPLVLLLSFFLFQMNAYAQGTVKGRVIFEGPPPAAEKVEVKSDIPTCGTTKEVSKIVLGADQGVANAVVRIVGAQGELKATEGMLDQVSCEFKPHVQVLPVGSIVKLTSEDAVLHNAHGFYEDGSTAFNIAVPIAGMEVPIKLKQPGIIKLRCDAGHTWMNAYVVVTEGPFYALTDANGNFVIEGIPPGHYEIEVWQEWLGKHREPIVVKEEGTETVTLTLGGSHDQ